MVKFFASLISLSLAMVSSTSFAEDGIGYEQLMICRTETSEVRIDRYSVYANDSVASRTQLVVLGELAAKLWDAGLRPTKQSSVAGEFIIDRLQRSHPAEGPFGDGIVFRIYSDGQWGEGMKVSLNGRRDALIFAYRGVSIEQTGLVCSR